MKFALQIYGTFRTFEWCLPHILQYIHFDSADYDVFILSQRSDGYSVENESKIREMLKDRIRVWKYIEDYPIAYHEKENPIAEGKGVYNVKRKTD